MLNISFKILYNFHKYSEGVFSLNRIKELRVENGLLQKDIEQRLNLGRGSISRLEKEIIALTPETIVPLCDLFGCTSDYLIGRSNMTKASITKEDAALLAAFHDAPAHVQDGIRALLNISAPEIKEKLHAS